MSLSRRHGSTSWGMSLADANALIPQRSKGNPGLPKGNRKIDVAKALQLRLKGVSLAEIGAVFGVTDSAVHMALKRFKPFVESLAEGEIEAFSTNRADILTAVEQRMIASMMDEDAIAKATLNNRAYAFQQIHMARRLEQGKSTENKSVMHTILDQAFNGAHASDENNGNNTQTLDVTPQEVSDDNKI